MLVNIIIVKYINGFLEGSCKDLRTAKCKKLSFGGKNGGNASNFEGEPGKGVRLTGTLRDG
jgi:hypothetical protein